MVFFSFGGGACVFFFLLYETMNIYARKREGEVGGEVIGKSEEVRGGRLRLISLTLYTGGDPSPTGELVILS